MEYSADETEQRAPPSSPTMVNAEREFSARGRERNRGCAHGQEPLHEKQQPPSRPSLAAQGAGSDTFRSKQNITVVPVPEEPPAAGNIDKDSRRPSETGGCPEPRTAKHTGRARRKRGTGGAHVVGRGRKVGCAG